MINDDLDYELLDRELDKTKLATYQGKNSAFLGSLMCSLNFSWVSDIATAGTNGINIYWNPYWFLKLDKESRITILVHELWHVALLHNIRCGTREHKVWNWACDFAINNMMDNEGYNFSNLDPLIDHSFGEKPAEEIYDILVGHNMTFDKLWNVTDANGKSDDTDLVLPDSDSDGIALEHDIVNKVVGATHAAMLAGDVPGDIEAILKRFLQPKLPWEQLLFNFFNDMSGQDFKWSRPNRRYNDVYLPSLQDDDNGLEHLIYYLDVSGSISDGQIIRFNSEVKFIKEYFNPHKLTLCLFDTRITKEIVFKEEDTFEEIIIIGRGGTDLSPVRAHIIEHKPTAAIIFSDLCCAVMEKLPPTVKSNIIWIAVNNTGATVNEGKLVHIRE